MSDPQPQSPLPENEEPTKPTPKRRLPLEQFWASLLFPPILSVLSLSLIAANLNWFGPESQMLIIAPAFGVLIGWIMFFLCIRRRYRGPSLVLLTAGYPIVLSLICGGIFFFGCLFLLLQ